MLIVSLCSGQNKLTSLTQTEGVKKTQEEHSMPRYYRYWSAFTLLPLDLVSRILTDTRNGLLCLHLIEETKKTRIASVND